MGSFTPGQRIEPSKAAEDLIHEIETKTERAVNNTKIIKSNELGMQFDEKGKQIIREGNYYIDIVKYFQDNY